QAVANLNEEAELTALAVDFPGSTGSVEESLARLPRFDSWETLLKQGRDLFDGAIVCLPNDRTPTALQALADLGKHVLMEKPGAGSVAALRPALQVVQRARVAFQSGYLWRYDAGAERLMAMVAEQR